MINNFQFKQGILLVCLIGIVGSAASLVNSVYPNNSGAIISTAVGASMAALFMFLVTELVVININSAIQSNKERENNELLAVVISRAVFTALKEDKEKKV